MNTMPEPVKPFPAPGLVRGVSIALILAALAVAVMDEKAPADPIRRNGITASEFESSWRRPGHSDLVKTLDANRVSGCSEMAYRGHRTRTGEYLVYCSSDGRRWSAWVAYTATQRVAGPYPADPLLPMP